MNRSGCRAWRRLSYRKLTRPALPDPNTIFDGFVKEAGPRTLSAGPGQSGSEETRFSTSATFPGADDRGRRREVRSEGCREQ